MSALLLTPLPPARHPAPSTPLSLPPPLPALPAVFDVDHDEERAAAVGKEVNGFSFEGMDAEGMDYALNRWVGPLPSKNAARE